MSGPTKGILCIAGLFDIPDCNPTFLWSDDARFLAVPQWKYFLRRRERLLVVEAETKAVFASPSKFRLLDLKTFSGGVITGIDSPIWKPRNIAISLSEVTEKYNRIE